jgi:uncharacterized membrane protein
MSIRTMPYVLAAVATFAGFCGTSALARDVAGRWYSGVPLRARVWWG